MSPFKNEIWRINFLSAPLNAWRIQFCRFLWRRIWATLFKNPSSLEGGAWMKNEMSPKDESKKIKFPIALKLIIVPLIEFSTESKKKLCVRIVSVVTVRPVNSWTWHGGYFGLTINGGQKKTTLWRLNSEWKRSFGSLGNRCTKPEVSRSYDFLNTRWNTWTVQKS